MPKSLKISYLHQYFTPPNAAGGTRSYEFACRLIAAGHEVHIFTSSAYLPSEYQSRPELIYETEIAGIPSTVINLSYSNAMGFLARIFAFSGFAFHASRVVMSHPSDVIFATSTPLTIAIPAILGCLWQRIPMVFEVRDLWPELPIAVKAIRNPLFKWCALWLEKVAYKSSAQIVALSPGIKDGIVRVGYSSQNVHVIPNSCDIELFCVGNEERIEFRRQFDWLAERPLVIYAGTLGLINGVGYLAKLANEMESINPDVRFLIIGRDSLETESVRLLADELGVLNKNFFMIPQINKNEMPSALAAADVATSLFIDLPEMQNNSANKFFDALASGTPVAINYGGWQADLLQQHKAGIVLDPSDLHQAALSLSKFLVDKERRHQSASSALNLARESFNRDDMAKKLEMVLHTAVNTKKI